MQGSSTERTRSDKAATTVDKHHEGIPSTTQGRPHTHGAQCSEAEPRHSARWQHTQEKARTSRILGAAMLPASSPESPLRPICPARRKHEDQHASGSGQQGQQAHEVVRRRSVRTRQDTGSPVSAPQHEQNTTRHGTAQLTATTHQFQQTRRKQSQSLTALAPAEAVHIIRSCATFKQPRRS